MVPSKQNFKPLFKTKVFAEHCLTTFVFWPLKFGLKIQEKLGIAPNPPLKYNASQIRF